MKLTIDIPTTLDDITLEQYVRYNKILETNKDDANSQDFINFKMLEIFCNVSYADAIKFKYKDIKEITANISNLLIQEPALVKGFKIRGKQYGFVPNLDELSFDEYSTLDTYITDWNTMHLAMAVLYRPVIAGNTDGYYQVEEYKQKKYWLDIMQMPLSAVVSSTLFFYHLGNELSQVILNSLESKEMKLTLQQELSLVESGVGITQFTNLLKETLQVLKK